MVWKLKPFILAALLATAACGTVTPNIEMRFSGHLNHLRSVQVVERAVDREDPGPETVQVVDAGNTQLDLSHYEILGSVRVDQHTDNEIGVRNWIWFNHFESPGRFGYCVWQTPLKMVTLGIWNIVPLAWPCGGGNPSDPAERLEYLSRYARRVAAEMGGDTMLMIETHSGARLERTGVAMGAGAGYHTGAVGFAPYTETTAVFDERNTGVTMLILRKLRGAPPPAPGPQAAAAAPPAPAPRAVAPVPPAPQAAAPAQPLPEEVPFGGRSGETESPYGARPQLPQ